MGQPSMRGLLVGLALLVALAGCNTGSQSGTPTADATETDQPSRAEGKGALNATESLQGATTANFLLAPNETQANAVRGGDDAESRYVVVNWTAANTYAAAGGNYETLVQSSSASNRSASDYYGTIYSRQNPDRYYNVRTQAYYESMVVRLYQFHGSAKQPQPFVVDWTRETDQSGQSFRATPQRSPTVKRFRTMAAARSYTQDDATSQLGGFGAQPGARVPALEHYRYVNSSERSAYTSEAYNQFQLFEANLFGGLPATRAAGTTCQANATTMPVGDTTYCMSDAATNIMTHTHPAWTKTFERVPGATIEGTALANVTIEATVRMRNEVTGEPFTYTQQAEVGADGQFTMTVPYSTTGYDSGGESNVSVRADGPYEFSVPVDSQAAIPLDGTAQVTEGQVVGENQTATSVDLTVPQNSTATDTDG